eukprot:scaffold154647_cov52-Attheya_sp.AAC.2
MMLLSYPVSPPSRGIVIVSPRDYGGHASMGYKKIKDVVPAEERKRWRWRRRQNRSTSGMPVLPAAIARSLSKAIGGRPVFWTCYDSNPYNYSSTPACPKSGTPGAAISQILRDIKEMPLKIIVPRWIGNTVGIVDSAKLISDGKSQECNSTQSTLTLYKKAFRVEESVGRYDIVIVLTGINDLKGIFLPFLQDDAGTHNQGFKEELRRLFVVLHEKLKLKISKVEHSNVCESHLLCISELSSGYVNDSSVEATEYFKENNGNHLESRPLVVIPAIPTGIAALLQYPPLGWAVHRLCELIDEQKRALAMEYPSDILYVEVPSIEMIHEFEKGQSVFIAKRKAEELLLDLKDITLQVRQKIENLISKHIEIHDFLRATTRDEVY